MLSNVCIFVMTLHICMRKDNRDDDMRFYLFVFMALGSAVALAQIIATKPKKDTKASQA